jgi:hypothetical protein
VDETPRNPAGHLAPHRWGKGQSGNPGGRPKGRSVTAALRELARSEHNGKRLAALLAERVMKEALAGKFPFLKEAVERLEGKVETAAEAAAAKPAPPHRYIKVVLCKDGVETEHDGSPPPLPPPPPGDRRENVRVAPPDPGR